MNLTTSLVLVQELQSWGFETTVESQPAAVGLILFNLFHNLLSSSHIQARHLFLL